MITKSDWQAVNRQLMDQERTIVGDPPSPEELLAYTRGELSEDEEARIRERLVCYPELVRALTEPFPTEGAEPGDADYMSDAEFAQHWASLQKRLRRKRPVEENRVLQFWQWIGAIAAATSILLGGMLWRVRSESLKPRVAWEQQILMPDGRRGAGDEGATLTAHGESFLLVTPLIVRRDYDRYRIELRDVAANRTMWRTEALHPREDDAFAILVPRRFLRPGKYQIAVYGVSGSGEEHVASYSLRVPAR